MVNFKRGHIIEVTIDDFAFGGKGLSRIQTDKGPYVIFTQGSIVGQRVKAKITKKRKSYSEARVIKVVQKSPLQYNHPYQEISGGPYISLPIERQHAFKKSTSFDVLKRFAEIENLEEVFDELVDSPISHHYRNKMEYSFSEIRHDIHTNTEHDDFGLGFKHTGTWWKVENLDKDSGMFDQQWEELLCEIRKWCQNTGLRAWHPPKKEGFFRHIVVRKSFSNDQLLINLITSSDGVDQFDSSGLANFIQEKIGNRLAGFIHTVNDDVADRAKLENGNSNLILGKDIIVERVLGLDFEVSMESFFQTNPKCAEKLYSKVVDYVVAGSFDQSAIVLDLFCGTGTIGQILAAKVQGLKVVGVDIVESAIENAKRNAERNKISNVDFVAADVGKFLKKYPDYQGKINTLVLDPPRAGIAPKTLKKVIALDSQRIVYVSCNPSTQARDTKTLGEAGYELKKISLVDQFPHTGHVESVALFESTSSPV